jgi:hypothetical protein
MTRFPTASRFNSPRRGFDLFALRMEQLLLLSHAGTDRLYAQHRTGRYCLYARRAIV